MEERILVIFICICSFGYIQCGDLLVCPGKQEVNKNCPKLPPPLSGVITCRCPRGQRCCQYGCGKRSCFPPVKPEICYLPKKTGPCRARFMKWFYNAATGKCQLFTYGGCKGNDNRFQTKQDCEKKCEKFDPCKIGTPLTYWSCRSGNKCPDGFRCVSSAVDKYSVCCQSVPTCSLPKRIGPCKKSLMRYYYNSIIKRCQAFFYGGCKGNANNFVSRSQCDAKCKKTKPRRRRVRLPVIRRVRYPVRRRSLSGFRRRRG